MAKTQSKKTRKGPSALSKLAAMRTTEGGMDNRDAVLASLVDAVLELGGEGLVQDVPEGDAPAGDTDPAGGTDA